MTQLRTITTEVQESMYIISLARTDRLNAFNDVMALELLRAFEEARGDKNIRAIILKGEGKVFCVGGDIQSFATNLEHLPGNIPDSIEVVNALISTMVTSPKPILAVLHGSVAGIGLSLALASDLAIASEDTQFTLAYAGIGLTTDGGASYWLPRVVGRRRALQMMLLPEIFSAQEAERLGLINWFVPAEQLEATALKIAGKLANGPTIAYGLAKKLVNHSSTAVLEDQLNHEKHAFVECVLSRDFKEGVQSFLQKRKPEFQGK